jgi:hypothetical protein
MRRRPEYVVIALGNHWVIREGVVYRHCVIKRRNGVLREAYVRDTDSV